MDDEVVEEYGIYHSTSSSGVPAFLLQFPLVGRERVLDVQAGLVNEKQQYVFAVTPPGEEFGADSIAYMRATRTEVGQPLALGYVDGESKRIYLTPISAIHQARPATLSSGELSAYRPVDWHAIRSMRVFATDAEGDVATELPEAAFLTQMAARAAAVVDQLQGMTEEALAARAPREQLLHKLLSEKTIQFTEVIDSLKLRPHTEELLSVLSDSAFFVLGRWTIKPEGLPGLSREAKLARSFAIAVLSSGRSIPASKLGLFREVFRLGKERDALKQVFDGLARQVAQEGQYRVVFKYRANDTFERVHPTWAEQGRHEVEQLMENVKAFTQNPHIFEDLLD